MDSDLLQFIRRYWVVLAIWAAVGAAAAYVFAQRIQPTYESTAELLVGPINADFDTQRAAGNLTRTYADLATSGPILRAAATEAGVGEPLAKLRQDVRATSNDVTRILTVRAQSDDPERARRFAGALAARLIDVGPRAAADVVDRFMADPAIQRLPAAQQEDVRAAATALFVGQSPGRLRIIDPPEVATSAVSPQVGIIVAFGLVAGLLVAAAVVLLREATGRRVEGEQTLEALEGVPFLGSVGRARRDGLALADETARGRVSDDYRLLATKIDLADPDLRTLLVVGADDEAGTGAIVANIVSVLPELVPHVTLVDVTTKAEITRLLGLTDHPGYLDLLEQGDLHSNGALERFSVTRGPSVTVIPRGAHSDGHPDFEAGRARALIERLRVDGSLVLVHGAGIERSPATLGWARIADGALVVVRRRKTTKAAVDRTLASLSMAGVQVLGTVLRS